MSDYTNAKRLQHDSQKFEREVMSWQKGMSDTSHQREVKDLKKAGLNPVLSAGASGGGGATSYTTSATDAGTGAAATWLSARQSAKAQRYAAAQSAAATRYAAGVQASAMVAASANNLAATKYAADMSYKTQTEVANTNKDAARQGSWSGLARDLMKGLGYDTNDAKQLKKYCDKWITPYQTYFTKPIMKSSFGSWLKAIPGNVYNGIYKITKILFGTPSVGNMYKTYNKIQKHA